MLQDMEIQDPATDGADKMEVVVLTSTTTLDLLDPNEELLSKGGSAPFDLGDSEEAEVKVIGSKAPTTATQPLTVKPDDGELSLDKFQRRKVDTIAEVLFRKVDIRPQYRNKDVKGVAKCVVKLPKGWNERRKARLVK